MHGCTRACEAQRIASHGPFAGVRARSKIKSEKQLDAAIKWMKSPKTFTWDVKTFESEAGVGACARASCLFRASR